MTKYVIDGLDHDGTGSDNASAGTFEAGMGKNLGGGEYVIRINGADRTLRMLKINSGGIEFILDNTYHKAKYVSNTTREISLLVDGVPISIGAHAELDEIVFKNSGGAGAGAAASGNMQLSLKSQIPGKVVSLAVSEGDSVKKGDVICTLESMKMQVAVKAHKDGEVKSIKIKESVNVAKGDVIADIV